MTPTDTAADGQRAGDTVYTTIVDGPPQLPRTAR